VATKVYMEALSPTMEEGTLVSWLKNEGDEVQEGDVIAEVETDKATMELAARGAGVIRKRFIGEGDTAEVGKMIAIIAGEDEDISDVEGDVAGGGAPEAEAGKEEAAETEEKREKRDDKAQARQGKREEQEREEDEEPEKTGSRQKAEPQVEDAGPEKGDGRIKASPLARRLAEEAGVDLSGIKGSGPGGRIIKRDIETASEEGAPAEEAPAAEVPTFEMEEGEAYRDVKLTQMRKTIAKRLTQSIGPVPHFFLTREVDMENSMALRKRINARYEDQGIKVSPNDLIIRAVAAALKKHPMVNAAWTGEAIRQHGVVHIGVAVAVEEGLITPVIRHADKKGVTQIAQEVREMAGRARDKKLKPEEYTGSTFSISNLGMFGIEEFTAVINPPEAAILAVGAVSEKPVVMDGEITVRPRMRITLSCDHRVIDGATGAQFLQTLVDNLEDPMMMLA